MLKNTLPIILVVTKNKDKYRIVVDILVCSGFDKFQYCSLTEFNITEDMEETGSIENRAKQKALFYKKILMQKIF